MHQFLFNLQICSFKFKKRQNVSFFRRNTSTLTFNTKQLDVEPIDFNKKIDEMHLSYAFSS
ncbi:MAG: hypothetical protein CMH44_17430 [Muricauda sp.]|nr:hypothetical protein [Allomuricauda sp.]